LEPEVPRGEEILGAEATGVANTAGAARRRQRTDEYFMVIDFLQEIKFRGREVGSKQLGCTTA
jgi:hypothetical protein